MAELPTKALEQYAVYMREVKQRTHVVSNVVARYNAGSSLTGYRESDVELAFLQLRKCLELVMFASLVAHYHSGVSLQKRLAEKEWNATKVMAFLARVNPKFFPKPLRRVLEPDGKMSQVHPVEGAMTKAEFSKLYDQLCGHYLHASRTPAFAGKHETLFNEISIYLGKLVTLLNHHWVTVTEDWEFAVVMQSDTDGDVHVALLEAVSDRK